MTNLSFALDSMAREIRTGTGYYCEIRNNYSANSIFRPTNNQDTMLGTDTKDCDMGNNSGQALQGISFIESGNSISSTTANRILYFVDKTNGPNSGKLMRRVGNNPPQSIISSGIFIEEAEFFVTGSDPLSGGVGEVDQPTVTLFVEARELDDPLAKPYRIQTTIVQRTLDI
jgi:hypothetical protein